MKLIIVISFVFLLLCCYIALARHFQVMSVNQRFTNMQAGKNRPAGLYYIQNIQVNQDQRKKEVWT